GEYCDLVPRRPATAAAPEAVLAEEAKLDPDLVARAVERRRVFELRGLDVERLAAPELVIDAVPPGATLLDLRTRAQYHRWLHLLLAQALRAYPSFDRAQRYVRSCDLGLLSAHLAARMRKEGFEVWQLLGGTRALRRLAGA